MKHLGGTNAIGHFDAGGLFPELARGVGQAFAGAHAHAQPGHGRVARKHRHLPVESGRGVADGGAHIGHQLHHGLRCVGHTWKQH